MGKKLTYEYVKQVFADVDAELLEKKYINNYTKMRYICSCGNAAKIRFYDFSLGKRCKKCGTEKIAAKQRYSYDKIKEIFKDGGCELLSKTYKNAHSILEYICSCGRKSKINLNHFLSGRRCNGCRIEKISGKNNYGYNFNITDEERKLKRFYPEYRKWRTRVYKRDDYTCQRCSQRGGKINAHHIENYSSNRKLRVDGNNGITMCKACHKKFHSKYGKKNNNRQQLEEFLRTGILCLN